MKMHGSPYDNGVRWRSVWRLTIAVLLAAGLGCGSSYPKCIGVTGHVTYHGKPVTAGIVSFVPIGQPAGGQLVRPATGDLQADGSYVIRTFRDGQGALPGEYAVTIVAYDYSQKRDELQSLPSLIPTEYGAPETSGLKVTIPAASGPLQIDFPLTD